MRKSILIIFCLCLWGGLYAQTNDRFSKFTKIVIDPGHGGIKPGARGKKNWEKNINLAVALKVGNMIKENLPDLKVVFTRTTDEDVDLIKRSQIANREKADLFLSIHCNSSTSHEAFGNETYVMGLAKTKGNIEAAKKENADILTEANYKETYDGFDPNSPEANIFFALYQNAYLEQSLSFASKIQSQYKSNLSLYNRGIKQAPYLVLWKTSVPCVLTEIGFISNPKEESYIASERGQYEIAACIFRAICEYKMAKEMSHFKVPTVKELVPYEVIKRDEQRRAKEEAEDRAEELRRQEQEKKAQELAQKLKNAQTPTTELEEATQTNTIQVKEENSLVYSVQFYADPTKVSNSDERFTDLEDISSYKEGKHWKYTAGKFKTLKEANAYNKSVVSKKYPDAFVVVFYNNKKITRAQAIRIEKQLNKK